MITYNKVNDQYSIILSNDEKVGHIEKHYDGYWIDVMNERCFMSKSDYKASNLNKIINATLNHKRYWIYSEERAKVRGFKILA